MKLVMKCQQRLIEHFDLNNFWFETAQSCSYNVVWRGAPDYVGGVQHCDGIENSQAILSWCFELRFSVSYFLF